MGSNDLAQPRLPQMQDVHHWSKDVRRPQWGMQAGHAGTRYLKQVAAQTHWHSRGYSDLRRQLANE